MKCANVIFNEEEIYRNTQSSQETKDESSEKLKGSKEKKADKIVSLSSDLIQGPSTNDVEVAGTS